MSAPQLRLKMAFTSRVLTWLCILSFVAMTGCHDDLHPKIAVRGLHKESGCRVGLDQADASLMYD